MATQTGSIDLKAAKKAHDDAEKVATNFVSDFSNGILVHPENDTDNGVKITDKVEIMRLVDGSSLPVAEFGETVRVGVPNNANKVEIQSDRISMTAYTGAKALEVVIPANGATSEHLISRLSYDWVLDYDNCATESITVNSTSYIQSATRTVTDSVLAYTITNDVAIDDTFEIDIQINTSPFITLEDHMSGTVDGTTVVSFEFTKKASGTYTKTVDNHIYWTHDGNAYKVDYSIQCTYNAATNEFSFYIKAKKNTSASKQFSVQCVIYQITFKQITLNSRTYINGDVFLNSYEKDGEPQPTFTDTFIYGGNLYMYIDEEDADSDLYDAIVALGWDADVLPPISFESV